MKKSSLIVSIAAMAGLILPLSLLAQDEEEGQGPLADVWFVVPKRGMEAQFSEAMAAHIAFRADTKATTIPIALPSIRRLGDSTKRNGIT